MRHRDTLRSMCQRGSSESFRAALFLRICLSNMRCSFRRCHLKILNDAVRAPVLTIKVNDIFESAMVAAKCVRARRLAGEGGAEFDCLRIRATNDGQQKARFGVFVFEVKTNDHFVQSLRPMLRQVRDQSSGDRDWQWHGVDRSMSPRAHVLKSQILALIRPYRLQA